eukprot:3436290-Amphidinium_carterae.1
MDPADFQVAQTLTTQRLEPTPLGQAEELGQWLLLDFDGVDGDYAAVWTGWGERMWSENHSGKLICTGTAPPDPSGVQGLKLAQRAVNQGAQAMVYDAPRVLDWSRAEGTDLGAAVWRQRSALIGRNEGTTRAFTPEELGLTTVVGTPARHFLEKEVEADTDLTRWVVQPKFVLEPQLGRIFSPTGPKGAGHIVHQGVRKVICSVGNPLPSPRVTAGTIEQVETWDPQGKP